MRADLAEQIRSRPQYMQLVRARSRFGWTLTIIMLAIYYGFILALAFAPGALGAPMSEGMTMSIGIPIGIAVIVAAFFLTWVYVRRANDEFDRLTAEIKEQAK